MNKQKIKDVLTELSKSQHLYSLAAGHVNEPIVTDELQRIAEERKVFGRQIAEVARESGTDLPSSLSKSDFAQQMKLALSDILVRRNVPRILNICLQADETLLETYRGCLEGEEKTTALSESIKRQYEVIRGQQQNFRDRVNKYPWFTNG